MLKFYPQPRHVVWRSHCRPTSVRIFPVKGVGSIASFLVVANKLNANQLHQWENYLGKAPLVPTTVCFKQAFPIHNRFTRHRFSAVSQRFTVLLESRKAENKLGTRQIQKKVILVYPYKLFPLSSFLTV